MLFSAAPVNSTPLSRNRFCCGRWPDDGEHYQAVVEFEMPVPPVFSESEIHDAGIQRHQEIVAAAVQRQVLDLLFTNQTGNVSR